MPRTLNTALDLARLKTFSSLPPKTLEELADGARILRFKKGETLFREGQPPELVNVVVQGSVKIVKQTSDGKEVILEIYNAPAIVQEEAVFQDRPYKDDGVGLDAGVAIQIRRVSFIRAIRSNPEALWEFALEFARRCGVCFMRDAQEDAAGAVDYRIARLVIRLAEKWGVREGPNMSVYLPLTRQEIADIVGTTVETAIRVMSGWKKESIVDTDRGRITITDFAGLRKIAKLT